MTRTAASPRDLPTPARAADAPTAADAGIVLQRPDAVSPRQPVSPVSALASAVSATSQPLSITHAVT